jgi:formylglycine-generating enzyme required for sulfatase activity
MRARTLLSCCLVWLCCVGSVLAQVRSNPREPARRGARNLALVVGIDRYDHLPALGFAQQDGAAVAAALVQRGFTVLHMHLGAADATHRPRSAASVLAQVDALVRAAEPGSLLAFYASAHGTLNRWGEPSLCLADCRADGLDVDSLSLVEVSRRFATSAAEVRALFLEANLLRGADGGPGWSPGLLLPAPGAGVLLGAPPGQRCFEFTGGLHDDLGQPIANGLFTHFLVRALGSAEAPTLVEIAQHVERGMRAIGGGGRLGQQSYAVLDSVAGGTLFGKVGKRVDRPEPRPRTGHDVSAWADVLALDPEPQAIPDPRTRQAIVATGWPWRVRERRSGCVLLLVPPGEFLMGSPEHEAGRHASERQHRRRLVHPFYFGETEVTQAQWSHVIGSNPSHFLGDERPVEQVSWHDVQVFLKRTGLRLPSEAEWEYACRAGTTTPYWCGGVLTNQQGCHESAETLLCGRSQRNPWGLFDLHGNVWEWCADAFAEYPADVADGSPVSSGARRVHRGGGWGVRAGSCRSATRGRLDPAHRSSSVGFRVARSVP